MSTPGRKLFVLSVLMYAFAALTVGCAGTRNTCKDQTPSGIRASQVFYSERTQKRPTDEDAWYRLGMSHFKLSEFSAGEQAFTTLIALNQDHAEAYVSRGICRLVQKDSTGACADFELALSLEHDPPVINGVPVSEYVVDNCR